MKIHEYNEMMAYLTRPGKKQGGVIGKGGMFQGKDMGHRTGYSTLLPKAIELAPKIPNVVKGAKQILTRFKKAHKSKDLGASSFFNFSPKLKDVSPPKYDGLMAFRKEEGKKYLIDRLNLLKDRGINFNDNFNPTEIADLIGIRASSSIHDLIKAKNIPTKKASMNQTVVKFNDFLNVLNKNLQRFEKAAPKGYEWEARTDIIKSIGPTYYKQFVDKRAVELNKPENAAVKKIYDKWFRQGGKTKIEGGHKFPLSFFYKEPVKGGELGSKRTFPWIWRNKDKLLNKEDFVYQSSGINQQGGPFYNAIGELRKEYTKLGKYVDKYEGKGAVKNLKDVKEIEKINAKISRIQGETQNAAKEYIKKGEDKFVVPSMAEDGLDVAMFNTSTGEVFKYSGGSKASGFTMGMEPSEHMIKLNTLGKFSNIIDQVVTSSKDRQILQDFFWTGKGFQYNEGGRVGLAEGTSLWDKTKSVGGTTWRGLERAAGPLGVELFYALTGTKPDITSPVELSIPAFWNQISKRYGWDTPDFWEKNPQGVKLKKRLINLIKRGGIPRTALPMVSRLSGIGAGVMAANYVLEESQPNILQGKFDPEKADQVLPALIEGYEKKWMGKDESPYMDYSDAMLKMKDSDDLKATYIRNQMRENQNQGGRVGFKDGSPKSPGRRAFIKGITALAALPIVGKFFKLTDVAKRATTYTGPAIEKIKGMPEWFPSLVKKLWNEGDDVTKQVAYKERMVVKRGTLEGGDDVDMIYDMDTGDVSIQVTPKKGEYSTKSGAYNKEYELDYVKGQADETTKGTPPDEFSFKEIEGRMDQQAMDVDWDVKYTTVDDAMTDLTELEAFAKDKSTKQIHKKKGTKPKDVFPDYDPY